MERYEIRPLLLYTRDHMWTRVLSDGNVTVGITDYAQRKLGEIVFVKLPEKGTKVTQADPFGEVESVKATVILCSPVSGLVKEKNSLVVDNPSLIAKNPYENWLIIVEPTNLEQELKNLLTSDAYKEFLAVC